MKRRSFLLGLLLPLVALPANAPPTGEMLVTDIYQGLGNVPRGSIKELRIVQIFPKSTWPTNTPRIGIAGEENARAILGTVPVEADGSARFIVPAHRPILFQALDAEGCAYQTMRATTSVQPGENTSCVGCHEQHLTAPAKTSGLPLAMQRPPSRIKPGELGGRPFSFVEMVQPVFNRRCLRCHSDTKIEKGMDLSGEPEKGFTKSYWSLCGDTNMVPRFVPRHQVQATPPGGQTGALGSRLWKMLRLGHNNIKLTSSELHRLAAWLDCNAVFYGTFDPAKQADQLNGERIPMPEIQRGRK